MQIIAHAPEQAALAEVTRDVLSKEGGASQVRAVTEAREPFDRRLWGIASELGWHGLEAPSAWGGVDQTFLEVSLVLRELGRTTTPGPYLSQQLALRALGDNADHPVSRALGERLVAGDALGAVALGSIDRTGRTRAAFVAERLTPSSWSLTGESVDVPDIGGADVAVVSAVAGDEVVVFALEHPATLLSPVARPTHDRTRSLFDISARSIEVADTAMLARGRSAKAMLARLWSRAATGIALDGVGGAARLVELTVAYTSQRMQYGRVIATFQAVKHTCSDMYVEAEVARVAADAATMEIATSGERQAFWSSVAKFRSADAYASTAGDALQMHGGIGMTWEFDIHYWLKRAKLNQALYGASDAHRAKVAVDS